MPDEIIKSSRDIMETIYGFRKARVILTAFELDIFTILKDGALTSAEVAEMSDANTRAVDRLMNALCTTGLLLKAGGRFSNAEVAAKHLVKGAAGYMGGIGHSLNLWDTWSTLTPAVRKGGAVAGSDPADRDSAWLKSFIAAMHQRAAAQASAVAGLIGLSGVKRSIDIGGGSGAFSIAMARASENLRAVVFDLPDVVTMARSYVAESGLSERFDFIEGDFNSDSFGEGYDLALLSAIIHMNSAEKNIALIKKTYGTLVSGGRVVVQDFIMNDDRTEPAAGAFFALNMLVGTEAGDSYTASEVRSWMECAGFSGIEIKPTPFDTSLVMGTKP